jgi:hypothetical protein
MPSIGSVCGCVVIVGLLSNSEARGWHWRYMAVVGVVKKKTGGSVSFGRHGHISP